MDMLSTNAPECFVQGRVHWADVLLSKLNDQVKLVGPTINCEGSPLHGDAANTWRRNPHVQSYVVATDRIGMNLLLTDPGVFQCYDNMWDTIFYSELGSSAAILQAGYNIDSLMVCTQAHSVNNPATLLPTASVLSALVQVSMLVHNSAPVIRTCPLLPCCCTLFVMYTCTLYFTGNSPVIKADNSRSPGPQIQ